MTGFLRTPHTTAVFHEHRKGGETLNPGNSFCRREKKLLIDTQRLPAFREDLLHYTEPDRYCRDGSAYEICNLYFDTPSSDLIRRSVGKPKFKEKVRLRSYGTPREDSPVFLEVKRKLCRVGTKRRAILPLSRMRQFLATHEIPEDLPFVDRQVLCEIRYLIECYELRPALYLSYLREAFYDKENPAVRVTLDSDVLTRREDLALESGRYGEPLLPAGKTLVEIKIDGAVPLWFAHLMSKYRLSFHSFSKYGTEYLTRCRENQNRQETTTQP